MNDELCLSDLGHVISDASRAPSAVSDHAWNDVGGSPFHSSHELERELAVRLDATHGAPFEIGELWRRLCRAEWRVRDAFSQGERLYAVVERASTSQRARLGRCCGLAMLEDVLLGQSSKVVAIERQLSPSAVASAMKRVMDGMGLDCHVRGIPQLLMLAARLARRPEGEAAKGRIAELYVAGSGLWVISAGRPNLDLLKSLSRAEREVILHLLDGCDYKRIAERRRTSLRTVANQVATAFRKLGLSGRAELVDRLLAQALGGEVGPPSRVGRVRAAQPGVRALSLASPVG